MAPASASGGEKDFVRDPMDLSTSFGLVAVVVLVLANGFFVATEFAIVAVRKSRLEQLAAEGDANARAARGGAGWHARCRGAALPAAGRTARSIHHA